MANADVIRGVAQCQQGEGGKNYRMKHHVPNPFYVQGEDESVYFV